MKRISSTYPKVIELYNSGTTLQMQIAQELGISQSTVCNYIKRGKQEGKIREEKIKKQWKPNPTYAKVLELYNTGTMMQIQIAQELGISKQTVYRCIKRYRQEGLLNKKPKSSSKPLRTSIQSKSDKGNKEAKKDTTTNNNISSQPAPTSTTEKEKLKFLIKQIEQRLQQYYPQDVAKQLRISPQIVYDVLDAMPKEEKNQIQRKFLENNAAYKKIEKLRKSNKSAKEVLLELESKISGRSLLDLSEFYYIMGIRKRSEAALNRLIYDEDISKELKQEAQERKQKLQLEYKAQDIREDYKRGRNMDGTRISYDQLCKKYNVRLGFIIQILGRESLDIVE